MATRKSRELKTGSRLKQRKSKVTDECKFPGQQERLPLNIPGAYEVAMGTREEVLAWLQRVPGNSKLASVWNRCVHCRFGFENSPFDKQASGGNEGADWRGSDLSRGCKAERTSGGQRRESLALC